MSDSISGIRTADNSAEDEGTFAVRIDGELDTSDIYSSVEWAVKAYLWDSTVARDFSLWVVAQGRPEYFIEDAIRGDSLGYYVDQYIDSLGDRPAIEDELTGGTFAVVPVVFDEDAGEWKEA